MRFIQAVSPLSTKLLSLLAVLLAMQATSEARVVSRQTAQAAGLTRAWFTQARIDPSTQRIVGAVFDRGVVYTLSSTGSLQAFDGDTGTTLWTTRLGSPSLPAFGPSIRHTTSVDGAGNETTMTRCAIMIGSTLFVIDGSNGAEVFSRRAGGTPATAPVLGDDHVYVSMLSGRLIGYPLDQLKRVPFTVASPGQLDTQPLLAEGQIIWTTRRGQVYGASATTGRPSYRFDATARISGRPSVVEDRVYFANERGTVYAMEAEKARHVWRASVGREVSKPVLAVGDEVYVQAEGPALYALDRASGKSLWSVEGVADFAAASPERIYAVAPGGALAVLDRKTGRPVGSWPAGGKLSPIANTEDDRLFFVSESGLLQSFHEPGRAEAKADEPPAEEKPEAEQPPLDEFEQPAEEPAEADPFAPADEPEEPAADDPFAPAEGAETDDPFAPADDAEVEEDDPFAGF